MKSLCVLGRQPALGLAELESLYGAAKLQPVGEKAVIVDVDPCLLAFDRLGGSVKFCKLLTELETTDWKQIEKFLHEVSSGHSQRMPEGKMQLGLSAIGLRVNPRQLETTGLSLKKAIRATGRPVRLIPNKSLELSSAQVIHNHLTGPNGWELVFIRNGNKTIIAQTLKEQDIEAYGMRDQNRPKRDAKVGMLPPKLAQIIINLAVGELPDESKQSVCDIPPDQPIPPAHFAGTSILDPFCGTGVVLQEALLMGYDVYGTDLEERMIDYSKENLDWLAERHGLEGRTYLLETGDATDFEWQEFTNVAAETYLGRPFSALPAPDVLQEVISSANIIHKKFLKNLSRHTKPGFRACLAVPAWKTPQGFKHLPVIDQLTEMGYTRLSFAHASNDKLIYHREGQIVGRELIVIQKEV
jgi:tRNA (guanine10-N2)-dimethyltransferase